MAESYWYQDPNAKLDYMFDWEPYLTDPNNITDTIVSADTIYIAVTGGMRMVSQSFTNYTHTFFVSGGIEGESYDFTSRIWTAGGRRDDRTLNITIQSK